MEDKGNTKRIAKNTLMLYFRQILILLVGLYTVRIVLNVLGAEDYGVYNVVGGVVSMFSFLAGSLSTASQRFFSYDLGKGDTEHLKQTFSMIFTVNILLVVIIVLISETLGVWFVENKIVLSSERMVAARWVYQLSIISFVFTILTTPFMACIIAHEQMNIYALVSIVEVVLKLVFVIILKYISVDKLVLYSILMFLLTFLTTAIYRTICHIKFKECKYKFYWDRSFFTQLADYVGWNLFGSIAAMVRNQGINILLNLFFGPIVNAARGIAFQINSAFLSFAQNFSTAVRPQIIKSYAAEEKKYMLSLVLRGTKFIYFLMLLIAVPLYLEAPFVLTLWLKNVPEHTLFFVRMVVIDVLIDSISYPIMSVSQATGKIRLYQAVVGGLLIMNLPVSYIFFKLGFPPEATFIIAIVISIFALFARIVIVQKLINCNLIKPFLMMFSRFSIVSVISLSLPCLLIHYFDKSFLQVIIFGCICVFWCCLCIFIFGLSREERNLIIDKIKNIRSHI